MKQNNRSILLVEDDSDTRDLMKFLLEINDFIVYEAVNGAEGIDLAKKHLPSIILMDISMPVMDGLTATKHLREYSATSKMPIIAVTAHGALYAGRASEAGFNELLSKPVDFELLSALLNKYTCKRCSE